MSPTVHKNDLLGLMGINMCTLCFRDAMKESVLLWLIVVVKRDWF